MIYLENDKLKIGIELHGAELRTVKNIEMNTEYMWSGDAAYWNRVSPVLFPNVGKFFEGTYRYEGDAYQLPQHGFLRDQEFTLIEECESKLTFAFKSTDVTYQNYPFKHEVRIAYELIDNTVSVHWHVFNLDNKTMYYSIGAHPAFAMNALDSYEFEIEPSGPVSLVTLEKGNVDKIVPQNDVSTLEVTNDRFMNDALVYTNVNAVTLKNCTTQSSIRCEFPGFDYVGLWSAVKDDHIAPFICIEPWLGIADEVGGYNDISEKLSIKTLEVGQDDHHVYRMEFL